MDRPSFKVAQDLFVAECLKEKSKKYQFNNLPISFKSEIFERMDYNKEEIRKYIVKMKDDISRKIDRFEKQLKLSQNIFKQDVINSVSTMIKEVQNCGFDNTSSFNKTINYKDSRDEIVKSGFAKSGLSDDSVIQADDLSRFPSGDKGFKTIDVNLSEESPTGNVHSPKIDNKRNPKIFGDVSHRIDMLHKQLDSLAVYLSDNSTESASLQTVNKVSNPIEVNNVNNENTDVEVPLRNTGTVKKILNDLSKKSSDLLTVIDEKISIEEVDEIVAKLASLLNVQHERQNVQMFCKRNSIVIQFQSEGEFDKWRGAARRLIEKERFSYQELLDLEEVDVIYNSEKFECPICLMDCDVGEGITLRDCLHSFCRQCIIKTVEHNTEMEIKCPFRDDDYTCPSVIQHREIKEVIPKELYEQYLDRTFTIVGNRLGNTVHCKTPDCRNFYICEDDVLTFYCDSCKSINCVPCKAVHTGLNCKQYQDELKILSETDPKARETLRMIDQMIQAKEAMPCPQCLVIVMKTEGCDWIQCSMCKTEICWATLGPRWGPEGRGDTSGGCQCKLNGSPCHVNCRNCH